MPGMGAVWGPQMGPQAAEIPRVYWLSNRSPRYSELSAKQGEVPRTQAKRPEGAGAWRRPFRPCLRTFGGRGPRKSPALGLQISPQIPRSQIQEGFRVSLSPGQDHSASKRDIL